MSLMITINDLENRFVNYISITIPLKMKFLIEISVDNVKKSTDSYGLVFHLFSHRC